MAAYLEIIAGPMFAGKTELLIARINRAKHAKKRIRILKPASDRRLQGCHCQPHGWTGRYFNGARPVARGAGERSPRISPDLTGDGMFEMLAVDEAQFFPLDSPVTDSLGWFGRAIRDLLRVHADRGSASHHRGSRRGFRGTAFRTDTGTDGDGRSHRQADGGLRWWCGSMEGRLSQRVKCPSAPNWSLAMPENTRSGAGHVMSRSSHSRQSRNAGIPPWRTRYDQNPSRRGRDLT